MWNPSFTYQSYGNNKRKDVRILPFGITEWKKKWTTAIKHCIKNAWHSWNISPLPYAIRESIDFKFRFYKVISKIDPKDQNKRQEDSLQPTPFVVPVHNVAELIQADRIHTKQCWVENSSRRHYQERQIVLQIHVTHLQEWSKSRNIITAIHKHPNI